MHLGPLDRCERHSAGARKRSPWCAVVVEAGAWVVDPPVVLLTAMNVESARPTGAHRQNGVANRFIGTIHRELLDHVIVLGEALQGHLGMGSGSRPSATVSDRHREADPGAPRGIDRETELDMKTDGQQLIIVPIRRAKKAKVKAAVERAMAAHDATLRKLAK